MKKPGRFFERVAVAACLVLSAACGRDAAPQAEAGGHAQKGAAAQEKHWGYEDGPDSVGPASWGDLPGTSRASSGSSSRP